MGFFSSMVTKAEKGFNSFLVHVNELGECVIHSLGPNGEVTAFTVNRSPYELIAELAQKLCPLNTIRFHTEDKSLVYNWCYEANTWAKVALELNRKPIRAKGRAILAIIGVTRGSVSYTRWVDKYIKFNAKTNLYEVTEAGKFYDEKFHTNKNGE